MIPIILTPKYGKNNTKNTTNDQSDRNNINDLKDNSNQTSHNADVGIYNGRPLAISNNHSASAYNVSNNGSTLPHQSYGQQNDYTQSTTYNTHYATTARTTHKYYPAAHKETTKFSHSQSNLNTNQRNEPSSGGSGGGFFSTLSGTLGRKKKISTNQHQNQKQQQANLNETLNDNNKELTVEQIENEGKEAIDSNIMPRLPKINSINLSGDVDESRVVIDESSLHDSEFLNLIHTLINWINDELNATQRIIVKQFEEDLYDGQVLGRLVEKLTGTKLDVVEFTQNEDLQKHKLRQVLETLNRILSQQTSWAQIKWSVEGIHSRNTVQIVHLLVSMIRFFRPPVKLPVNVSVRVNVITKDGIAQSMEEMLTEQYDETGMKVEPRDAFDTLFDHAPDKLAIVKQSLCAFANKHLNKINIECFSMHTSGDLDPNQFSDGLLLIFLMASLENYFVPLGNIFTQPADPVAEMSPQGVQTAVQYDNYVNTSPIHKLHNVNVAFQLMKDADIDVRDRLRAEDIVNADLKSTLRVLYMIFNKYKNN